MATFDVATTVEGGDGRYTTEIDPEWTIGDNPHGGYLLALLARAALATAGRPDQPHPLATNAVYLSPPRVGPATIEVEPLRLGRTASQLRARLLQDGRARVEAIITLGRIDPAEQPRWVDAPPVDVAPEQQCHLSALRPEGLRIAMAELVEQRIDLASLTVGAEGSGEIRGWLRFADGTAFDPVSLLYAADGFPPATFTLGSVGWVPTLTLTVYVRAIPAPGALRVRQRARVASGAFVDQVCDLWDERGRVVAQATQLVAVRFEAP